MYKWAVYLNNKCSKEQPEALSVVGKLLKKKKKERKSTTFAVVVLTNWKRYPLNSQDEDVAQHKNICALK